MVASTSNRAIFACAVMCIALPACSLARDVVGPATDAGRRDVAVDAFADDGFTADGGDDASVDAFVDAFVDPSDMGGVDGGPPGWTVAYTSGAFTRASEGSALVATPGSAGGFMTWAAANVARSEDRGDGAGALLLVEGARTNLLVQSRAPSAAEWALPATGGAMLADNADAGPDGAMTADLFTGTGYSRGQHTGPAAGLHTVSAWGRASAGTSTWTTNFSYPDQPLMPAWSVPAQTTQWTRLYDSVPQLTAGNYYPIDLTLGFGPLTMLLDLHQVEEGSFASSAIRTEAAPATRAADVLVFAAASLPPGLFVSPGGFAQLSPVFSSADAASISEVWLLGIAGGDGIRLRGGTSVVIEAIAGGLVRATSAPLVFGAHALIGPVSWSPTAGSVTVGGVAGAPGTPWVWAPGDVRIGGIVGGAGEAFARFGALRSE